MPKSEVTDKQLESQRARVDKLREQIDAEKMKASASVTNSDNALRMAQLENEEDRLKMELESLRTTNKEAGKVVDQAISSLGEEPVPPGESGSDATEVKK